MACGNSNRRCISPVSFTILMGATVFIYIGSIGPYTAGILTTIQREFQLKSSEVMILFVTNDIVGLLAITPLAYIGNPRHRPRILGVLTIIYAFGCALCALPQFLGQGSGQTGPPRSMLNSTINGTMGNTTNENFPLNLCIPFDDDDLEVDFLGDDGKGNLTGADVCSKAELAASGAQFERAVWLAVGQAFIGLGSSGYFTLGFTYMDDGIASKSASAMHFAIVFTMVSISPIVGFALSAFSLSLHTDFYKINVDDLGYDDKDPRWVGAWWIGFIIYAILMLIISIPFFFFPKKWPKKEPEMEVNMNGKYKLKDEDEESIADAYILHPPLPENGTSCLDFIKGYFKAMGRVFTNMTYMAMVAASIADAIAFLGCFSFIGRYLQTQYDVSPSATSIILGCVTTPPALIGNLSSGIFVKGRKLGIKGVARVIVVAGAMSLALSFVFLFISCPTTPIAGINVPYGDPYEDVDSPDYPSCLSECSCVEGVYIPVCGADGVTYITPCFAGCQELIVHENGTKTYADCSCIVTNHTYSAYSNVATPEKCRGDCDSKKISFLVLFAIFFLIVSFCNVPAFMMFMRCVEAKDKAVAIGLSSLLSRVLAYIPAPIFFGAAIQSACLMFQESCGKTGNCFIFDNESLTKILFGLVFGFKGVALILYTCSYFSLRRDVKTGEYGALKVCVKKEYEYDAVNM